MKFKVVKNQKWLFWASGMVIYPFVIINGRVLSKRLFRHELEHCYQIQRMGVWKFYLSYIVKYLTNGYWHHPYEREARQVEYDKLTAREEQWYQTGEIDLSKKWLQHVHY